MDAGGVSRGSRLGVAINRYVIVRDKLVSARRCDDVFHTDAWENAESYGVTISQKANGGDHVGFTGTEIGVIHCVNSDDFSLDGRGQDQKRCY